MKIIRGLVLIFLAAACIRDIDPNTVIKDQSKLVIFSFIDTDDDIITVSVALLEDFYNQERNINNTQNYISKASVTIDDGVKYSKLVYDPLSYTYRASTTTFPIKEGKTYNLTVKYQFVEAKASCTVPVNDAQYYPELTYKDSAYKYQDSSNDKYTFYNSIKGKFYSRSNSDLHFIASAQGCGNYTDRHDSTYYTCDPFSGLGNYNNTQIPISYVTPDTSIVFIESDIPMYDKVEILIRLLDDPSYYNRQYNSNYKQYDPLGEPSSSYSNFTNAYGVFGASSTRKITMTFK